MTKHDEMTEKAERQVGLILKSEFFRWALNLVMAALLSLVTIYVNEMRKDIVESKKAISIVQAECLTHAKLEELRSLELRIMQIIATLPPADWKARVMSLEAQLQANAVVLQEIKVSQAELKTIIQMHMESQKKQ